MYSNKVRLLHLIKTLDIGGIEKSTILYSNILVNKLESISIFANEGFYDNSGIINDEIKRFYPRHNIWEKRFFIQNLTQLISVIKKNKITHIHYHHRIYIPFIYFIKLSFPKIKIIYTHHNCFNDFTNNFVLADKIIALNEATKNDLPKRLLRHVIIIPHGVVINNKIKNQDNPKNIGFVGRFVEEKGILNLIQAFKDINEEIPDTKLILVGEGPLKNKIVKKVKNLGLNDKVVFQKTSISEDEIYSNIDILVLPAEKLEGFGLVILEAMARGIPVVTNNLSVFNEIIINKFNGIITDSASLKTDILSLIDNKIQKKYICKNALKTVYKDYNLENTIRSYLQNAYYA